MRASRLLSFCPSCATSQRCSGRRAGREGSVQECTVPCRRPQGAAAVWPPPCSTNRSAASPPSQEAEVQALPRIVAKRWPGAGIDIVVNTTAAPAGVGTSLMGGSTADWAEAISTDVLGTALVTREALTDMERRGSWGHVVSVACAEEGGGLASATQQAVCAMAQELRCVGVGACGGGGGGGRRLPCTARWRSCSTAPPAPPLIPQA